MLFASPDGKPFADGYHLYAIEWEPNEIRWYVDDHLYVTRKPSDLPGGTRWVFDHDFFIILNVAVGGAWPGNPDGTTRLPAADESGLREGLSTIDVPGAGAMRSGACQCHASMVSRLHSARSTDTRHRHRTGTGTRH